LKSAGLDRVTVSLDSLDPARFAAISDTTVPLRQVVEGIEAALQAGLAPLKLNCVLQRGVNEQDALPLADWARERGFIARFIEFMDVGSADHWHLDQVVPSRELQATIHAQWPLERIPDDPSGRVAHRFRYLDGRGEVGFISSVTEPFCAGCDRARLSADGHLYTCLFAGEGLDFKRLLRGGAGDAEILGMVEARWRRRDDRYSEIRTEATARRNKVAMHRVGG
jgi:cyclic pyranopterin phosphate synthase